MDIRKIIREEIGKIFEQEESMFGNALTDIDAQLQGDLDNVGLIIKTQQQDIKNMDTQIKGDLNTKSKLDAKNPHKKGLEREIPERQKDMVDRKKQLKNLEDAKKGLEAARIEIQKQKLDMEKQAKQSKPGEQQKPESSLPSLESPI